MTRQRVGWWILLVGGILGWGVATALSVPAPREISRREQTVILLWADCLGGGGGFLAGPGALGDPLRAVPHGKRSSKGGKSVQNALSLCRTYAEREIAYILADK